jgi:RND family efflux transporter MFP subunit
MQGMPVQTVAVTMAPVAQSSEYVATIKSRRSATLQPQVSGMLTEIRVRSGDHVKAGQVLMEIDPRQQQATVESQRATERQKKALYDYNTVEVERQRKLFEAGVTSRDAYDQAQQAFRERQGGLRVGGGSAQDAGRATGYYTIRAPFDGVVGDIPVHVGDYVSPQLAGHVLTTVDENKDLEAYIYVPTERAGEVRQGLAVNLTDNSGKLLEKTKDRFLSPEVDSTLQGILVKAPVHSGPEILRNAQMVKARRHLEHEADGGGSGAGGDAPGRAELRVRGAAAERNGFGAPDAVTLGDTVGNNYSISFGTECGRQGDRVQHAVPGERHAGDADAAAGA